MQSRIINHTDIGFCHTIDPTTLSKLFSTSFSLTIDVASAQAKISHSIAVLRLGDFLQAGGEEDGVVFGVGYDKHDVLML